MTSLIDPFFSSFFELIFILYRKGINSYKLCYVVDKKHYIFVKINLKRIVGSKKQSYLCDEKKGLFKLVITI